MNETTSIQTHLDFTTGRPSYIHPGVLSAAERQACAELNRHRAFTIKETARKYAFGGSVSRNVWAASFARTSRLFDVPLIDLSAMGFSDDDVETMSSKNLGNIGWGREATAWTDLSREVVYKLFDLKMETAVRGTMGLKLVIEGRPPDDVGGRQVPAVIDDILEKICVLHEAGGCPTEIAGLSEDGKYLIAKQPLCFPMGDFREDQREAVRVMNAISPKGSYGNELWVFHSADKNWLLSDLHDRNIMRLADGSPTVIDALTGELPPYYFTLHPKLNEAARRAKALALGKEIEPDDPFHNVLDEDL